mgnify:CR=1 FL=1
MFIKGLHHVAYRCTDARETVDFYTQVLGLKYTMAVSERQVPSTKESFNYMHLFFELGSEGGYLAFFELPDEPAMGTDPNTPDWVQHLAFRVLDIEALREAEKDLRAKGLDVLGPIDHGFCESIYFHDPSGHRLEFAANKLTFKMIERLSEAAQPMLEEWTRTHKVVRHSAWVHEKELGGDDKS